MSSPSWSSEPTPRVAVLGAGAIGGWLAAGFARAGWRVDVLARGATLAALRAGGLVLCAGERREAFRVRTTDDPADITGADLLLLGLKGHDLPGALPLIEALCGPRTLLLSAQNGLPWWFFRDFGGAAANRTLAGVDPGGRLAAALPVGRVLAAVVHATARTEAPGVVRLLGQDRVLLGDPAGGQAAALADIVAALGAGGVTAVPTDDIRGEIWRKLWGNATMNPLSALARADTAALLDDDGVRGLILAMMREMAAIGDRIGLPMGQGAEERLTVTRKLGGFRTSMLQDLEADRRLERGPILGALVELAAIVDLPVPTLAAVDGLLRLLEGDAEP